MTEPLYLHTCTKCKFLGTDIRRDGEPSCNSVDLYACEGALGPTLIRRYSSEESNYGAVPLTLVELHAPSERYAEVARRYLESQSKLGA